MMPAARILFIVAGVWLSMTLVRATDAPPVESSAAPAESAAADAEGEAASISVRGVGWWKGRELKRMLELLQPEDEPLRVLDAAFVEDAIVLLQSALEREGFLRSSGSVRLRRDGEELGEFTWTAGDVPVIPRELIAEAAVFGLEPGQRFTFEQLEFAGLQAIESEEARSYFVEDGFLLGGGAARRFTPAILQRGVRSLREQLVRLGFANASVAVAAEERDEATGKVAVTISVDQGARHRVGRVVAPEAVPDDVALRLRAHCAAATGVVYSPLWRQDFTQEARAILGERGYATAEVRLDAPGPGRTDAAGDVVRDFRLQVTSGPKVQVGDIRFGGEVDVAESVLQRAVQTAPGAVFNRAQIDQDRLKLSALGVFSSVRTAITRREPDLWDVTYELDPGKRLEWSVLLGYGSYEGLRGGIEVMHANFFERAHRGRLQLVYSLKSAHGDYLYTVPQIFGTSADVSARLFGLDREEVSFDRREYGVSLGVRRHIGWLDADAALRYQFESVNADIFDPSAEVEAPTDSTVASLVLDLTQDKLDNPISPQRGTFLALALETATQAIGGEVDYQRVDLRASWHRRLGRTRVLHLGFRQGVVLALGGSPSEDIPFARRYFPGGEGTLRGYVEGRASPRDADGNTIGAEVSTIVNAELEQRLAQNFSAVVFVDAGLTAASLTDFPGDEFRMSVGVGLRYNTVIGPARLEYGHNVVRETGDSRDAWHLALGFPF